MKHKNFIQALSAVFTLAILLACMSFTNTQESQKVTEVQDVTVTMEVDEIIQIPIIADGTLVVLNVEKKSFMTDQENKLKIPVAVEQKENVSMTMAIQLTGKNAENRFILENCVETTTDKANVYQEVFTVQKEPITVVFAETNLTIDGFTMNMRIPTEVSLTTQNWRMAIMMESTINKRLTTKANMATNTTVAMQGVNFSLTS